MTLPNPTQLALEYARARRQSRLDDLLELLRFPTISSQFTAKRADFEACTDWLVKKLLEMGFERAERLPTGGPEVVYAEWLEAGEAPTLLIYGHYDVMPVEPLSDWRQPPFEPLVDEKRIHARGASDDKGQFFALLCAAEAWIRTSGLPVNLKVLLEGEEEETSHHLVDFIRSRRELLSCDGIVVADMDGLDPLVPLVEYGMRGNCSMEVTVRGPAKDLHSGTFGGAVDNPLNVLVRMLAQIQDGQTRKILVPGFYDKVKELTEREQALLNEVPISDEAGLYLTGVPALGGEAGYPLKTRISARPTFEIHGIRGGYTGEGTKTVIPAIATAKLSFRLVPDQTSAEIYRLVAVYLAHLTPPTVQVAFKLIGSAEPTTVDLDAPVVRAATPAFLRAFGAPPRFVRGGGSLPILTIMQENLNPEALVTGFGLPEDGEHAPNESLALGQFYQGIEMMVYYFEEYRKLFGRHQVPEADREE
jgi:acetylornithine deacetylase/succinyl-diaminopimelate desuccinylase-like protein